MNLELLFGPLNLSAVQILRCIVCTSPVFLDYLTLDFSTNVYIIPIGKNSNLQWKQEMLIYE